MLLKRLQNIDPEDHATLDTLALGAEAGSGNRTLADIIFSKMQGGAATSAMDEEGELYKRSHAQPM